MTDNAWAYRYTLPAAVAQLGAKQVFSRPYCPWPNGKVERLNRTLQTEWASRQVYTSNAQRSAALAPLISPRALLGRGLEQLDQHSLVVVNEGEPVTGPVRHIGRP